MSKEGPGERGKSVVLSLVREWWEDPTLCLESFMILVWMGFDTGLPVV